MKRTREQGLRQYSGFTLIEILVVAALISLFAGLAMFSVETFTLQSKRKAAQADARGLGDALDVAHFQYGFYPKPCFLSMSSFDVDGLKVVPDQAQPNTYRLPNFDVIGYGIFPPLSRRVVTDWTGPYLPEPVGRAVSPKSGVVKMDIFDEDANTTRTYPWPADPWGNPYVVYLMGVKSAVINGVTQSGPALITRPTQAASYFGRVVSYGPNGIPGGRPRLSEGLATNADAAIRRAGEAYMLYTKRMDADGSVRCAALKPAEYETLFGKTADTDPAYNRMAAIRQTLGYMNVSECDAAFKGKIPGIMDAGSDDITAPLH